MNFQRLLHGALLLAALALTAYLIADFLRYEQARENQSIQLGEQAGTRVAEALDARLNAISARARAYAQEIVALDSETQLLQSISEESQRFPLLLGVTVAFEPGQFGGRDRYAPFFNKSRDEFQFVERSYDYTDPQLATAEWYTTVIATGEPQWSAPYYAEAAEAMVVDYGVPLIDASGELIGMVDYTIALSDFTQIVDSLSIGESGYGFTYDAQGAILSHPNPDYLLDNVFQEKDGKDRAILAKMQHERQGVVAYNSTYTYKYSWFFFRELESTGWKSVLVFAVDDLLGASDEGRRKIIHIALGVSLLLVAFMLLAMGTGKYTLVKLWWLVAAISIIVLGNIVLIWHLNLKTDFSLLDSNQERIVNQSILKKYVEQYDRDLHKLTNTTYTRVPTGIFVESYELNSFEASIIGKLWMKYPLALYDRAPPAFYFPGVSAIESRGLAIELVSETPYEDHVLVTWKFRGTLEQDFSYQQFPFEQNDIRLLIFYPDFSRNILLVPDLDSYDVLNPSAKPGLSESISVPSSETISSFFTFEEIDYKTSFGNETLVKNYPALTFNMVAKRIWLSPFIANIIPILIVALIMFIVLYVSSNKEEGRTGLTTMNVIQSSAGFLFILVLAHVNERNRIETPEIAYIELFYFSMYVFITLEAVALAALLRGTNWKLFTYRDNLALKLMFWPVLVSTWLALTLLRFY
ncbi:MAG: cache domain-containing protein [Pseudomonadales bacterium]|nr:cache domain-containing protein [Pseudomonadales bacterium]MCP5168009.1 cache domain-containing protein [Pseudomonadales bacterium]MCP5188380.1 cache domain-containing protein [Pseudomonadales bacterium]